MSEVSASSKSVGALYDHLSRQVLWSARRRRYRGPTSALTMHKTLRIPSRLLDSYPREQGSFYINDLALEAAQLEPQPDVLDAGCGFGGTVFRWHDRIGGSYDGLTLSRVQWRAACREARSRGLTDTCRFYQRSYDLPLEADYDAVVVIEALIHSPDVGFTLENLTGALRPGGRLVLVEDTALEDADRGDSDFDALRSLWRLATVPSVDEHHQALAGLGLEVVHEADYSEQFDARDPLSLARLERRYRWLRRLAPLRSLRTVLDAYRGGLALERLYRRQLMQYRLLVARKG